MSLLLSVRVFRLAEDKKLARDLTPDTDNVGNAALNQRIEVRRGGVIFTTLPQLRNSLFVVGDTGKETI